MVECHVQSSNGCPSARKINTFRYPGFEVSRALGWIGMAGLFSFKHGQAHVPFQLSRKRCISTAFPPDFLKGRGSGWAKPLPSTARTCSS
jgi:hypothetical protein